MTGVPPKKGVAFTFTTALTSQSDTKLLKANPTIASGDCQVSKAHGAFANLTTLPDAEPDAGYAIRVQLSATEMDADVVTVLFHDAAGAEWCDQLITIQTDTATIGEIEALVDDIGVAGAGLTAIPTIANVDTVASTTTIGATGLSAIAAAVWNALTSGLTAVGSVGAYLLAKLGLITSGTTMNVVSTVTSGVLNLSLVAGETRQIAVTLTDSDGVAIDLTDAAIEYEAGFVTPLTKSLGSGITVTDAAAGQFTIDLEQADTVDYDRTLSVLHECKVLTSGGEVIVVFTGRLRVTDSLIESLPLAP